MQHDLAAGTALEKQLPDYYQGQSCAGHALALIACLHLEDIWHNACLLGLGNAASMQGGQECGF